MKLVKDTDRLQRKNKQISDEKAEEAIKTIIEWIGEEQHAKV
jgi:GTP cyclohydrolase I